MITYDPSTSVIAGPARSAIDDGADAFFASVAAFEVTAPPYEWPSASTGPLDLLEDGRGVGGVGGDSTERFAEAVAGTPLACSRVITPFRFDASACAPWMSTTVGVSPFAVSDMSAPFSVACDSGSIAWFLFRRARERPATRDYAPLQIARCSNRCGGATRTLGAAPSSRPA
jgi:hypothetical protein